MTGMETEIREHEREARQALAAVGQPTSGPAREALDRFDATVAEILALSRRNSNVHSLALSVGRKRLVAAQCDADLESLERAVLAHGFTATR